MSDNPLTDTFTIVKNVNDQIRVHINLYSTSVRRVSFLTPGVYTGAELVDHFNYVVSRSHWPTTCSQFTSDYSTMSGKWSTPTSGFCHLTWDSSAKQLVFEDLTNNSAHHFFFEYVPNSFTHCKFFRNVVDIDLTQVENVQGVIGGEDAYRNCLVFVNSNLFNLVDNNVCKKKYTYHDYQTHGLYFYNDTIFPKTCKLGSNVYNLNPGESSEIFPTGTSGTTNISFFSNITSDRDSVYYTFSGFGHDSPIDGQYFGDSHIGLIASSAYFFVDGHRKNGPQMESGDVIWLRGTPNSGSVFNIRSNDHYYTKYFVPETKTSLYRQKIDNYYYSLESFEHMVYLPNYLCPVKFTFKSVDDYVPVVIETITDTSYFKDLSFLDNSKYVDSYKYTTSISIILRHDNLGNTNMLFSKNALFAGSASQSIFTLWNSGYLANPLSRFKERYAAGSNSRAVYKLNETTWGLSENNALDPYKGELLTTTLDKPAGYSYRVHLENTSDEALNKQYYEFNKGTDYTYFCRVFTNLPKYMFTPGAYNADNRSSKIVNCDMFSPCVQILNYQNVSECSITWYQDSVSNKSTISLTNGSYTLESITNSFSSNYFNIHNDHYVNDSNVYTVAFFNVDTSASTFTPDLYNSLGLFKSVAAENRIWGRLYYLYQSNKSIGIRVNGVDYYVNLFEGLWSYPNLIRNVAMSILHVNYIDYVVKIKKSDGTVLPIENCTYDDLNEILTMQVYTTTGVLQKLEVIDYKGSAFKCPMFSNVVSDVINKGIQFTPFYYPVTSSDEILSVSKETGMIYRNAFDFIKFDLPVTQGYTFQNSGKYLSFINFDFNFETPVEMSSASSTFFSLKEANNIVSNNFGYDNELGLAYPSNEYSNFCTFIFTGNFVSVPNVINVRLSISSLETDSSMYHSNFTECCSCQYNQTSFALNYTDNITKKIVGLHVQPQQLTTKIYLENLHFTVIKWDSNPVKNSYPKELNESVQSVVSGAVTNDIQTRNISVVSTITNNNYSHYLRNISLDENVNVSQSNKYSLSVTSNNSDNLFYGLTLVGVDYSTPVYQESNDIARNASLLVKDNNNNEVIVSKSIYTGASLIESPGMPKDVAKSLLPIVMPIVNESKLSINQENSTSQYNINIANVVNKNDENTSIENIYNCQSSFTPLYNINDNYNSIQLGKINCILCLNFTYKTKNTHNASYSTHPKYSINSDTFTTSVYKSANAAEAFEFDSSTYEITFYKKKYLVFSNIYCSISYSSTNFSNNAIASGLGYILGVKPVGPEYTVRKLSDAYSFTNKSWFTTAGRRSMMSVCECSDSDIGVKQPFVIWGYTYANDIYVHPDYIQVLYISIDN